MAMLMPLVNLDAAGPKAGPEIKPDRGGQGFFFGILESAFSGAAQARSNPTDGALLGDDAAPAGEDAGKEKDGKETDGQDALAAGAMAGLVAATVAAPAVGSGLPKTACTGHDTPAAEGGPAQEAGGPSVGAVVLAAANATACEKGAASAVPGTAKAVPETDVPAIAPAPAASAALPEATAAVPGEGAIPQVLDNKMQELPAMPGLAAAGDRLPPSEGARVDASAPPDGKAAKIKTGSSGINEAPQPVGDEGPDGSAPSIRIFEKADALAVGGPVEKAGRPEAGKPAHPAPATASPGTDPSPAQPGQARDGNTVGGVAAAVQAPAQGTGGELSRGAGPALDEVARKAAMPKASAGTAPHEASLARPAQVQADSPEGAQQPTHAVKEGVLAQFSDGFNSLLKRGGDGVVIRLSPPSLGNIKIEVVTHGHEIRAKVTADNAAVRDILSDNQSSLKSSMQDSGLSLREFSVGVDGGGAGGRWAWTGTGTGSGGQPPSGGREGAGPEAGKGAEERRDTPAGANDRSRLNLVV